MFKALIIEDEVKAQRVLDHLLRKHFPEVSMIFRAENVLEGIKIAQKEVPDIVFLDIEMPVHSGFKFLEFFEEPSFEIIFTTAYSDYTTKAYEMCAIGYLLKPIQISHFKKVVDKALTLKNAQNKEGRLKFALESIHSGNIRKIVLADA